VSKRLDYNQIAPEGLETLGGVHGYIAQSSRPATLVGLGLPARPADQELRLLPRHANA